MIDRFVLFFQQSISKENLTASRVRRKARARPKESKRDERDLNKTSLMPGFEGGEREGDRERKEERQGKRDKDQAGH